MKLHWLQHVPFEDLGHIEEWANKQNAEITCSRLFADEKLPELYSFDWLIIMGGPMGVYDQATYPWLTAEKAFIKQSILSGKIVLGICLGAQLIADVLGAKVYPGPQKEIGWFPIHRAKNAPELIPNELTVFHWHGDTFDLPDGAVHLASSDGCQNQGFIFNNRTVGLQFHMETTPESIEALMKNCGHELINEPFIQTAEQIQNGMVHLKIVNDVMTGLLDSLISDNPIFHPQEHK